MLMLWPTQMTFQQPEIYEILELIECFERNLVIIPNQERSG